jgi:hypothetical protein
MPSIKDVIRPAMWTTVPSWRTSIFPVRSMSAFANTESSCGRTLSTSVFADAASCGSTARSSVAPLC